MPWLYKYSKEFLDYTIQVWQPLSKEPLTYVDAEEIIDNAAGFYVTLLRWAREAREKRAREGPILVSKGSPTRPQRAF